MTKKKIDYNEIIEQKSDGMKPTANTYVHSIITRHACILERLEALNMNGMDTNSDKYRYCWVEMKWFQKKCCNLLLIVAIGRSKSKLGTMHSLGMRLKYL